MDFYTYSILLVYAQYSYLQAVTPIAMDQTLVERTWNRILTETPNEDLFDELSDYVSYM